MGLFSSVKDTVGGLAGGLTGYGGAQAARAAGRAQQEALEKAMALQRTGFNGQTDIFNPQRAFGMGAMNLLSQMYGFGIPQTGTPYFDPKTGELITSTPGAGGGLPTAGTGKPDWSVFLNSPDYKYAKGQSLDAVDARYGANGSRWSGAAMGAINKQASGLASQNFGDFYNRLMGMTGVGTQANNALSGALGNTVNSLSDLTTGIGNAQAGAQIGAANSYGNAAGNLLNMGTSIASAGMMPAGPTFNMGGGGYQPPGGYGSMMPDTSGMPDTSYWGF